MRPLIVLSLSLVTLAAHGCARRSCEEVTADREALRDQHQACTVDDECGVFSANELLQNGCGVIALQSAHAQSYAERENELADESEDVCDEDDSDDIEEALGEGIACALTSIFVSDDPADYQARCTENVCTAVLLIP